jgi:hypothetical protein
VVGHSLVDGEVAQSSAKISQIDSKIYKSTLAQEPFCARECQRRLALRHGTKTFLSMKMDIRNEDYY